MRDPVTACRAYRARKEKPRRSGVFRRTDALSDQNRYCIDTPEVDLTTSTRARLVGDYDGGADLFGVAMQYKF